MPNIKACPTTHTVCLIKKNYFSLQWRLFFSQHYVPLLQSCAIEDAVDCCRYRCAASCQAARCGAAKSKLPIIGSICMGYCISIDERMRAVFVRRSSSCRGATLTRRSRNLIRFEEETAWRLVKAKLFEMWVLHNLVTFPMTLLTT